MPRNSRPANASLRSGAMSRSTSPRMVTMSIVPSCLTLTSNGVCPIFAPPFMLGPEEVDSSSGNPKPTDKPPDPDRPAFHSC